MNVCISKGNTKMGAIPSVSLPSIITCRKADCHKKCYANKIERIRKNVRDAYARNLHILLNDPVSYWREVEAAIMAARFFRFHVSGDILDKEYFANMVDVASRNQHCEVLCFTKKYEIVNHFVETGGEIPDNLHIIFSAWVNLDMVNPFLLPEAHVRFRNGETTASINAKECAGNCAECARTNEGCWTLQNGDQVVFNEH